MSEKPSRRDVLLIALVLAGATFAVYGQALGHKFISYYDDATYVTENVHVQSGLNGESVRWAFTTYHGANWHPLTWLSHALDVQLFGMNPMGHHLVNVILHVVNTLLLFTVLLRITRSVWKSSFVAALFGVHPQHVESVAWVAERKDVLSALFWMLGMLLYTRYVEKPSLWRYSLVVAALAFGLMAKPMLVSFPIALLLLDYWPLGRFAPPTGKRVKTSRWPGWKLILEKTPMFAVVAASSVATYLAQRAGGAVGVLDQLPMTYRITNALVSYAGYLVKMVWPAHLAFFYRHLRGDLPVWQIAMSALWFVSVSVLVWRHSRKRGYLGAGWLWYVVTLIPVIGIVQVGQQAMADRYTYIPFVGVFVIAAWGIPEIAARLRIPARALSAGALAILCVLWVLTWKQVSYWHDSKTLFEHALDVTEKNDLAHYNLGMLLKRQGRYDEAMRHYEAAIAANPECKEAVTNIGVIYYERKDYEAAIDQYRKALELNPSYATARNNLGLALVDLGRFTEAKMHLELAIKLAPDNAKAYNNLGMALMGLGETNAAVEMFTKAIELDPKDADFHYNFGLGLVRTGNVDEAVKEFRKAVDIRPNDAKFRNNLGNALAQLQDYQGAIVHLREALRIKPDYANAHFNLALALFFTKDYAGAWREMRLAEKCGGSPSPELRKMLSSRMPEPKR